MPSQCVLRPTRTVLPPTPATASEDQLFAGAVFLKTELEGIPSARVNMNAAILILDAEGGEYNDSEKVIYWKKGTEYTPLYYDPGNQETRVVAKFLFQRLHDVYEFYHSCYGRLSLDGRNSHISACVMWGEQDNATWDGSYGSQRGLLAFGTPNQYMTNWALSLDIVGHEATHGVVHATTQLEYTDQSGALEESLADCFGSMMKHWKLKQADPIKADWEFGSGIEYPFAFGLRNFKDPGSHDQPSHMGDYRSLSADEDNGGVHTNSGIPNHAFYLAVIAVGRPSWEVVGSIWYNAMTDEANLSHNATFSDFARVTLIHSPDEHKDKVKNAWKTVGVLD